MSTKIYIQCDECNVQVPTEWNASKAYEADMPEGWSTVVLIEPAKEDPARGYIDLTHGYRGRDTVQTYHHVCKEHRVPLVMRYLEENRTFRVESAK